MTGLDAVLLVVFGAAALTDWYAVGTMQRRLEVVAKPATTAVIVALAATSGDLAGYARAALVIGALFAVIGDVALLNDDETSFMAGLGAFALGHLAYAVAAVLIGVDAGTAALAVPLLAVLLGFRFVTRTVPGATAHGDPLLAGAVVFYACVISAMVVTAYGTRSWVAALGASLFAVSDWILGHERFVAPIRHGRVAVHVTYFVGQVLLVLGLAAT
ncbi:hypothetical protein BH24ACT6_BH24ACT6_08320 [soil metagenome]